MESRTSPWLRLAPWLVLLAVAYAAGRWREPGSNARAGHPPADQATASTIAPVSVGELLATAQTQPLSHPRIAGFIAALTADRAAVSAAQLGQKPPSLARDHLLLAVIRRWAELAPGPALAHANTVQPLPLRADARAAAYTAWASAELDAAFARVLSEASDADRGRSFAAMLAATATVSPVEAVRQWQTTPAAFRTSAAAEQALTHIAEAASSAERRAMLQSAIASLPVGDDRSRLTAAVARQWGRYEPEAAVEWIKSDTLPGEAQDALIDEVFSAFLHRDPVRAAAWAVQQPDEKRRSNYVAVAVAEWALYDSVSAETWVNEQEQGTYLDGATSAIAAHFIEHRLWPQAFAWTRRILRNEARADLLGNLGRLWNADAPAAFSAFLAQTSLNRAELEMLRSKIVEVASP